MYFWDWKTGYNFQRFQATAQPGSLDSESGIFALTFDQSQSRMITCEADKTVKIYREDDTAVCIHPSIHPFTRIQNRVLFAATIAETFLAIILTISQYVPRRKPLYNLLCNSIARQTFFIIY